MSENIIDKAATKDAATGANNSDHDALITRVAQEMGSKNNLISFDKAPENAFNRYGSAAVMGLAKVPEGMLNAVKHDINHPLETLGTIGVGAGTAVVLKAVLPEAGPAGKIAAAAIGTYFIAKAAEPVVDGFKKAGVAQSMADLNAASTQIGDAGGAFIVNSALAAGGYKLGGMAMEPVMGTSIGKSFAAGRDAIYSNVGGRLSDSLGMSAEASSLMPRASNPSLPPAGYGFIPPHVLENLSKTSPDALKTLNETVQMQNYSRGMLRPNDTPVTDYKGARETYDAQGEENLPGKLMRKEGDKPTGNQEVDEAHDFTGFIREFYQKEYGRNSIDGQGMKLISTVNYGQNYENAFWNGQQMTYGKPGADSPFKTFMLLDVAGHEMTHGVTEKEAGLQYYGQSGALNESISDVFGNLVKQYANHQSAKEGDWLVGGGIWKDNIKGRALRDMLNPGTAYDDPTLGKDPQPANMKDYMKTWQDNGGVHYNSGIPNKAFATFAVDVGGNAWDAPGHIWFAARKAAGSNASFASFAYHTIDQAKALGHTDLVPKLEKAWDNVGVKPDKDGTDTTTPSASGSGDDGGNVGKGPVSWIRSLLKAS